jgi:pimeloyl-ACP methyl ester carboxylesterase
MTRAIEEEDDMRTTLAYTRSGTGAPLVLLHGLGSSVAVWESLIPLLTDRFDVIAVDLPGFGRSAPLPGDLEPLPAAFAAAVAAFLDELGIQLPHVVGNSLGGWVALELAKQRPTAAVTLLSPAGLWAGRTPLYNRVSLRLTRWFARHATRPLCALVRLRLGRILVLGQTHSRPARLSAEYARDAIRAMGHSPGFAAAFAATLDRHYIGDAPIAAPVTVAFGSRDRLLLRRLSRHLDELPDGVRIRDLPRCGHVPMADDPALVAALIAESAPARPSAQTQQPAH